MSVLLKSLLPDVTFESLLDLSSDELTLFENALNGAIIGEGNEIVRGFFSPHGEGTIQISLVNSSVEVNMQNPERSSFGYRRRRDTGLTDNSVCPGAVTDTIVMVNCALLLFQM